METPSLLETLFAIPGAARVGLWLWLRRPHYFTTEEISQGIPLLSKTRIQQIVQLMHERGLVDRQIRVEGGESRPGPPPYEYRLVPALERLLR